MIKSTEVEFIELTQLVNENVNAMIAAYNAGESGFDWEPMVNAITKLQREAVVAALERVKAQLPVIDVEAYPGEQWRYSGEPRGSLDEAYTTVKFIDAEIERMREGK